MARELPMSLHDQARWWEEQKSGAAGRDRSGVFIDPEAQRESAQMKSGGQRESVTPKVEARREVRPMQPRGTERGSVVGQEKAQLAFLQSQEGELVGDLTHLRESIRLNGKEIIDMRGQLHNLDLDVRAKEAELHRVREMINQVSAQSGGGARQEREENRFAA